MKKFFLFATAAVALTVGCQKQELTNVDPLDNGELVPVTFGTNVNSAVAKVTTKAALETLEGQTLFFFGVKEGSTDLTAENQFLLGDMTGAYDATLAPGETRHETATYYGEGNYNFYGYYDGKSAAVAPNVNGTIIKIPVEITGQEDLLIATSNKVDDVAASGSTNVDATKVYSAHSARRGVVPNLVFNHQLTQFTFKLENGSTLPEGITLKVKDLAVKSFSKGDLTIDITDNEKCVLTDTSTIADFSFPKVGEDVATFEEGSPALQELDGSIMVIPGQQKYDLVLSIAQTKNDGTGTDAPAVPSTLDIELPDTSKFLAGHSYEISVKVYAQEAVILDVTLADWKFGAALAIDPDKDAGATVDNTKLAATLVNKTDNEMVFSVNVPAGNYYNIEAGLTTDKSVTPQKWVGLQNTLAMSAASESQTKYAVFDSSYFMAGTKYFCMLRYTETDVTVSDSTVFKYSEPEDNQAAVSPAFKIKRAYLVHNDTTYNYLPQAYRTAKGEWGTAGLSESLPWLAVEFTPAENLTFTVKKNGKLIKTFSGAGWSRSAIGLVTISGEELGQPITSGLYEVIINSKYTAEIMVPYVGFAVNDAWLVKDKDTYDQLPQAYRTAKGEWGTAGLSESLPWLAVTCTADSDLYIRVYKVVEEKKVYVKDFNWHTGMGLFTINEAELKTPITAGKWVVWVNGIEKEITVA